jgi:Calcineurin-like phosphoesterase
MKELLLGTATAAISAVLLLFQGGPSDMVVYPYLQNPAPNAMTITWLSRSDAPGRLVVKAADGSQVFDEMSKPVLAEDLAYLSTEMDSFPEGKPPALPYIHRVRVSGLQPGQSYDYTVSQGSTDFARQFRSSPADDVSVRFMVYADSETEPESTGKKANWPEPFGEKKRVYLVDQTDGYRRNLEFIESRKPDFIAIAGDLVETGGEQRDWDEFWRHNAGEWNDIASTIPIFPAVGNHENYAGAGGGYGTEAAGLAVKKFQTYFETPPNGTGESAFDDRFYRIDHGPITFLTIDGSDGRPDKSASDTNFLLRSDNGNGEPFDFNPGSIQYEWIERQLADAKQKSKFTFVQFHHVPYSVGPHGFPAGRGEGLDTQSGQPLRILSPLFEKYGVAAVFCGHDEMYEHSVVNGIHYYDIGIGGDGLRGPSSGPDGATGRKTSNANQAFLAHINAKEVWDGKKLVEGGKHYGHLEVNVSEENGIWQTKISPVYIFPVMNKEGKVIDWERRIYDDEVVIRQ